MYIKEILNKILNHRAKANRAHINPSMKSSMLFKDYFINYLIAQDGQARSRSYSITLTMASHIIDGLGNYRMNEINKDVLKKFINGLAKTKYEKSPKTHKMEYYSQSAINKIYNLLHGAIKEAASEDGEKLLRTDFMANIKKPRSRRPSKPEPKALTIAEIRYLLKIVIVNKMIFTWVCIMLYSGVRPSEALALKFEDINYAEKTISITKTLSQEDFYDARHLKKIKPSIPIITDLKNEGENDQINWQRRTLKVGNMLLIVLHDWENYVKRNDKLMKLKRENGTENFLFCGSRGQLWLYEYYQQIYERILKKHRLSISEYSPYRFRHNCCTNLFRLGEDIKTIQLIMGDNTPTMVMKVYANLDSSDVLKGSKHYADNLDMELGVVPHETNIEKMAQTLCPDNLSLSVQCDTLYKRGSHAL